MVNTDIPAYLGDLFIDFLNEQSVEISIDDLSYRDIVIHKASNYGKHTRKVIVMHYISDSMAVYLLTTDVSDMVAQFHKWIYE